MQARNRSFHLPVRARSDVCGANGNGDTRLDAGIGLRLLRKIADQRKIAFRPRLGEPDEEIGAAIDSPPVAAGRFAKQRGTPRCLAELRKLEGSRSGCPP